MQLRHYLAYGYLAPDGAPLNGVRSLPPASVLAVDADGGERLSTYWQPPENRFLGAPIEPAEIAERLGAELRGAVERQLVADVPVGVFLSPEVSTRALSAPTGCDAAVSGPVRTFSVGFEGPGAVSTSCRTRARWPRSSARTTTSW